MAQRKETILGVILLVALALAAVALVWKYVYPVVSPMLFERFQRSTSDAARTSHTINIGGDNYFAYFFIVSPEMRNLAGHKGYRINFNDDRGAYAERLKKFKEGEYDLIVLPINSYVEHGSKVKFPGTINVSIGESKGADAIVGFGNVLVTGNISKDLNDPNLRIVYVPNSPSSFLLEQTITHFDLFNLRASNQWRVEVNTIEEVLEKAKKNDGDVFVLWEPALSKALKIPNMKYIWGSDKFSGLIDDVMVFRREYLKDHRKEALMFLELYFQVMKSYTIPSERTRLVEDMCKATDLKKSDVEAMLAKIDWHDLKENCALMFGIGNPGEDVREGVADAVLTCTDILVRSNVLPKDPTKGDPYIIIDRSLLEELNKRTITTASAPASAKRAAEFSPKSDSEWRSMREVGSLRTEQVTFQIGKDLLDDRGKSVVSQVASMLTKNYPQHYFAVRGHTGPGPDEAANRALSLRRAQIVSQYLKAVYSVNDKRFKTEGIGSEQPPRMKPGESQRAYRDRLSRVEFVLLEP